jgi:putative ABC transport system substrate-binding protein
MREKTFFGLALCTFLFALSAAAVAQQPAKMPRIGILALVPLSGLAPLTDAFRQGLRELGHQEGKNILIEWRSGDGRPERLPALAAELVRLKVDIIVSGGNSSTHAAKKATNTIPIAMTQSSDPAASGFASTLARPGENITGLSMLAPEISGKRLELLKEIVPKLSRVAVFGTSTSPGDARELREVEVAAEALAVKLQYVDVLNPKDIEKAFQAAAKERADAVLMMVSGTVGSSQRKEVADLVLRSRLPVINEASTWVDAGGLMRYGVNRFDLDRRAATYVDKILKGAKPADLLVEQPKKFELVINLKTAKQMGLAIPPNVLARADRVIR